MTLYGLILFNILHHSVYAGTRVAVALYAIHLAGTPFTVGVLMALFAALPLVFSVSAGRLSDRVGARGPMVAGCGIVIVGASLPFLWRDLAGLYAASVLIGTGFMFYQVAMQNVVGYIGRPEDRAVNFSVMALGFSASAFIGPMIAGAGIDGIGHAGTFLLLSLFPVVPLAALAAGKLELPQPHVHRPQRKGRGVIDLLRNPQLRLVFVTSGLLSMGWDLFAFVGPVYGSGVGLSATMIGLFMSAFAAATFTIRLFLPLMARRLKAFHVITAALLLSGGTYFLFPFFTSLTMLIALSFLLGIGLGAAQPMVMAMLHDTVPPGRAGEAVGVRAMLISGSQTLVPLVFGAVSSAVGMKPVFWTIAALLVAGGVFASRRPPGR